MLIKALRVGLGHVIVLIDWLTRPKAIKRSPQHQESVQKAMASLSLYQLYACPFCVKTRRALHKLNVHIEIKDIGKDPSHRQALHEGGGRIKVPCMRIEEHGNTRWMYESNDIIAFLKQRVTEVKAQ